MSRDNTAMTKAHQSIDVNSLRILISVPEAYRYVAAIMKSAKFCHVSIVIASTFFKIRKKMTPSALLIGLSAKHTYIMRGTTIAPTSSVAVVPIIIKVVPMTASKVAKNSLRLTVGSDGRKKYANIITRNGEHWLIIEHVVSGKNFMVVKLIYTPIQNCEVLRTKLVLSLSATLSHATDLNLLFSQSKIKIAAPIYLKTIICMGCNSV